MFEAAASRESAVQPCLSFMHDRCIAHHSNSRLIVATGSLYLISFSGVVVLVPLGKLLLQLLYVDLQTACIQVLQEQL